MTPVAEYNIDGSNALSIDRNGILYAMDPFDVYCYDLNSSDPEEPGDALDYMGSCYSSKDRDLTVIYWTDSAPVLVQDGEYTELTLEATTRSAPSAACPPEPQRRRAADGGRAGLQRRLLLCRL